MPFKPSAGTTRYLSRGLVVPRGTKTTLICEVCDGEFVKDTNWVFYRFRRGHRVRFCGAECQLRAAFTDENRAHASRSTAARRSETLRAKRPRVKGYPKLMGRHAHRVIAEKILGRPLKRGEVVHHKDEDIGNWSEDNLVVCASQAEHRTYHPNWGKRKKGGDV